MEHKELKKNILFVLHTAHIGGAAQSAFLLLNKLNRKRYNPIVWLGDDGPYLKSFIDAGFKTYVGMIASFENTSHFPATFSFDYLYMILKFLLTFIPSVIKTIMIVKKEKISLIHINSSTPLVCGAVAKLMKIRVVWHVREVFPENSLRWVQRKLIEASADAVIAISKRVQREFSEQNKVFMVYNPIRLLSPKVYDVSQALDLRKSLGLGHDTKIVAIIGQVMQVKGHFVLLNAARNVLNKINNIAFIIVGASPRGKPTIIKMSIKWLGRFFSARIFLKDDDKLRKLIEEFGLSQKIIFLGYRRDIESLISLADILVCPNITEEAFGRTIIEAGVQKKVVIASRLHSFIELIEDHRDGVLVNPNDHECLANAIIEVISDQKKAIELGETLYNKILSMEFDENLHVQAISRIYDSLI